MFIEGYHVTFVHDDWQVITTVEVSEGNNSRWAIIDAAEEVLCKSLRVDISSFRLVDIEVEYAYRLDME